MVAIGLIPARGGSKGIPQKNIALLAGKPLIGWTCEAARHTKHLSEIFLSTDDQQIANVCMGYGVQVPFLRPANIAGDETPMVDVLKHFVSWLESKKKKCDALVLLQPTSPLRTAEHIGEALEVFEKTKADSLVSVTEVAHSMHPWSVMKKTTDGFLVNHSEEGKNVLRRQDKPQLWARNGPAILITTPELIKSGRLYGEKIAPYPMSRRDSVDVDEALDLEWAEFLLKSEKK